MSDHLVDVYDENYQNVGVELKSIAHKKGLWHQVISCIIINSKKNKIYFQKKVPGHYSFEREDYIDITVGGHYMSGEKIEDGTREIKEETGFDVDFKDLFSLGIRKSAFSVDNKYFAYEYQHLFLCDLDCELKNFYIDEEEISGFVEVDIDEFLDMLLENKDIAKCKRIFKSDHNLIEEKSELSKKDIVPAYLAVDKFILRVVIAAKRYVSGERRELIFW